MNNKEMILFDHHNILDTNSRKHYAGNGIQDTEILVYGLDGKLHNKYRNKIILPGAAYTATAHFDVIPPVTLPNYNTVLGLDESFSTVPESREYVYLFAVSTDGCGPDPSQIYDVSYKNWTPTSALIPFKYGITDIDAAARTKYFGRKLITGAETRYAYYFKGFEAEPVMRMQYKDGTPIDANIYDSLNALDVETFVELKLRVTNEDCRDWYKATTGIATAKINSIMLLRAWPKVINGITYYQNIQPLTKLNISNEPLTDETKGLDIIYHLYY